MDERFFKSDYVAFRHVESGVDAISWFNLFSSFRVIVEWPSGCIETAIYTITACKNENVG